MRGRPWDSDIAGKIFLFAGLPCPGWAPRPAYGDEHRRATASPAHVPAKWAPGRRQEHAPTNEAGSHDDPDAQRTRPAEPAASFPHRRRAAFPDRRARLAADVQLR